MKLSLVLLTCLMTLGAHNTYQESDPIDLEVLLGQWTLDMSPHDLTDDNFAMMSIIEINDHAFAGEFYREGVKIKNAQLNTQLGKIYGALTSGDRSGTYHSTFYYEDGVLHGTTHAVDRNFLAVWTATKTN